MQILEWLESIRNPVLTGVSMAFTALGSEMILIAVLCLVYWCVNKRYAYRLGFIYFISGIAVQALKIVFKVERPWVKDSSLTPVKSALSGATGYSFPSGHTQNATALYGTGAWFSGKKWFRAVMIILIFGVMFSRMYLGVHTPSDVAVGFAITAVTIIIVNFAVEKNIIYKFKQSTLFAAMIAVMTALLVYGVYTAYNGSVDMSNAADYFKSVGAGFGFVIGWYMETNLVKFDEKSGTLPTQILKYIVGIAVTLAIKSGLKAVIGTSLAADFVRYAVVTYWVIYVYPLIFSNIISRTSHRTKRKESE